MPARDAARRHLSTTIAAIERHNGPDDPRLPALREQLDAATAIEAATDAVAGLNAFITRARVALLPFTAEDIASAGRLRADLDSRRRTPDEAVPA
jgi:hypothetical protein